jgi:hypothetical protein
MEIPEGEDAIGRYHFRGMVIPAYMLNSLKIYVEHGQIPGSFLQAVICNDLRAAVERADANNITILPAYVSWLYNEAPAQCWGSPYQMDF